MVASKEEIAKSKDWDTDEFEVKDWGTLRIRSFSAKERKSLLDLDDSIDGVIALIAMSLIDGTGELIFNPDDPKDREILEARSWPRLEEVAKRIMRFNGLSDEDNRELEKN
jgi:hypothetical protein